MARWTYLAADLRTNIVLGELPLASVRWSKILNGAGQMQAELRLGNPDVHVINPRDLTGPARRVLYALRDDRPIWGGIIWARDYNSATRAVPIVCADWWSYFDHRKVLEVLTLPPATPTYIAGLSKLFTQEDQNDIARGLVELAQTHTGGDIGIVVDAATSGVLRDRDYTGFDLSYVGQALRDLTGLIDGIDIVFDVGPQDANGRPARIMRTGNPAIEAPGALWRFDLGGNLLDFDWSSGGGVMATRSFAQGTGTDRGTQIGVAEDTSRYTDGWPLLEADDIFATVSEFDTLTGHAEAMLAGLSLPLVTLKLKLAGGSTPMLGEYAVGDSALVVIPAGVDPFIPEGLELSVRLLSIECAVDDEGGEDVTLTCITQQEVV